VIDLLLITAQFFISIDGIKYDMSMLEGEQTFVVLILEGDLKKDCQFSCVNCI
jgi:hypothetical protein